MNPEMNSLAQTIVSELKALADPKRQEFEKKYFKNTINNFGVSLPKIDKLERSLCAPLAKSWSVDDAVSFSQSLLEMRIHEVTLFALTFLERFASRMGESELIRFEDWLARDLCDNWAAVDNLCPHVVGTILANHSELLPRVANWATSENRWLRRGSAVSFILLARKGTYLDSVYNIAEVLINDKSDDLVQKGNGWMLREAGTTDPDRLEEFLLLHGPAIPRTTLRYAIEKFPKEKRAELLVATKRC